MLVDLVKSATDSELRFIAELDYGVDAHLHFPALQRLVRDVEGDFAQLEEHYLYPREVIELGASWLQPGHEREFAICTLLWVHAIATEADGCMEMQDLYDLRANDYAALPKQLRDAVLRAFSEHGIETAAPKAEGRTGAA